MGQPLTQHRFMGEVAPEFYGNTRNPLHASSLRTCKNFLPIVHGALVNRPGTLHIGATRGNEQVRLIPFVFSDAQALVLEFGTDYIRFYKDGGLIVVSGADPAWDIAVSYLKGTPVVFGGSTYVARVTNVGQQPDLFPASWTGPYAAGDPYEIVVNAIPGGLPYLKYAQSGDVITICYGGQVPGSPAITPQDLTRISNSHWTVTSTGFTPVAFFGSGQGILSNFFFYVKDGALPPLFNPATAYALNDVVTFVIAGVNHSYVSLQGANVGHQPDDAASAAYWAAHSWSSTSVWYKGEYALYKGLLYLSLGDANINQTPDAAPSWWVRADDSTHPTTKATWAVTQIYKDEFGVTRETLASTPFVSSYGGRWPRYTDRPVLFAWGLPGLGAGPANYKLVGHNVYFGDATLLGLIGSTDGDANTFEDKGEAPDFGIQPPRGTNPFLVSDGQGTATTYKFPAVVFYDNAQRRGFARSGTKPSTFWASAIANFERFDVNFPQQDADSYEWKLASRMLEEIRSAVTFGQLCFFTGQGEWSAQGVDGKGITANNVQARKHSSHGSGWLDPVEVENALLFITAKGNHIRDFAFDYSANAFVGADVSEYARHLLRGHTIVDWAHQRVPYHVVWLVRDDGLLLSCTYDRATQTIAWAQHPTNGTVESVCCVPEGTEDALYVSVNRNSLRGIERMASRDYIPDVREACFLDAALQFDGRNTDGSLEMKVTGVYAGGGEVTVQAMTGAAFAAGDVGDRLVILPDGIPATYDDDGEVVTEAIEPTSIEITVYTDPTHVTGILSAPLPAEFQATPTSKWGWARDTITGLSHLEGLEVMVLADANVQGPFPVAGGQITLKPPALIATVGLRYNSDAELLDIASDAVKPNVKAVSRVILNVVGSRGIEAGETFEPPDDDFDAETDLMPAKLREITDDFDPTELVTGQVEVPIGSTWNTGGRACIRQKDPLPLTITSVTRDVEVGGRGG